MPNRGHVSIQTILECITSLHPYRTKQTNKKTVSLNDYCGIRQYPSLDYVEQLFFYLFFNRNNGQRSTV